MNWFLRFMLGLRAREVDRRCAYNDLPELRSAEVPEHSAEGPQPPGRGLWLVDLEENPFRVRYRLVGTEVVRYTGLDFTGRYLDELERRVHANAEIGRHGDRDRSCRVGNCLNCSQAGVFGTH